MPAGIEIRVEKAVDFAAYARVSIAYRVVRVLVPDPERGPLAFRETRPEAPWHKDYDREPGAHPTLWPERFDTSSWRVFSAWRGEERVGGAVLVHGADEIEMLEGRTDLALVWDLRVAPAARGRGVGSALMEAAEAWARARGCTELKVETQNVNARACAFYEGRGFELRAVDPDAYPGLDEIQMLWYRAIR